MYTIKSYGKAIYKINQIKIKGTFATCFQDCKMNFIRVTVSRLKFSKPSFLYLQYYMLGIL